MAIFTKGGDKGRTSLCGGIRVEKSHTRIEVNGAIDEANSFIGLLRCKLSVEHPWQPKLQKVQTDLMHLMSHIATVPESPRKTTAPKVEDGAAWCEEWIAELDGVMGTPEYFVLPGQTEISALCHIVRTIVRRAERHLSVLVQNQEVELWIPTFVNRLSDLFFTLALYDVFQAKLPEERVKLFRG